MNGPQHYREAERLIKSADFFIYGDGAAPVAGAAMAAQAQVHATLALAAATAMHATVDGTELGPGEGEFQAWYDAAGVKPRKDGDR